MYSFHLKILFHQIMFQIILNMKLESLQKEREKQS